MKIGVPKEIKTNENRIALVPAGAEALVAAGHSVLHRDRRRARKRLRRRPTTSAVGASIAPDAATVWRDSEMIMKVKEPIEREWPHMRRGQLIFTYFHFAADEKLTRAHIDSGATCVAYETVELPSRELPLLTPMSEVAGRMAVQEGAKYLEKLYGGRGVLLGGVPGVAPAKVVILGGGIVGINAAKMAAGTRRQGDDPRPVARASSLPIGRDARQRAAHPLEPAQHPRADRDRGSGGRGRADSRREGAEAHSPRGPQADAARGRSSWTWRSTRAAASRRSTRRPTRTRPTSSTASSTTAWPTCRAAYPRTSTFALTNATLPYAVQLANKGWKQALKDNSALLKRPQHDGWPRHVPRGRGRFGLTYENPSGFIS